MILNWSYDDFKMTLRWFYDTEMNVW
jgi:hypothetical protein